MFGFSLGKLVVAMILILAVWYGFKMMGRIGEVRAESLRNANAAKGTRNKLEVEDLTECKRCGAFVSAGAKACARDDCPYSR
ncbi:MAG: hypothetical protein FJX64_03715 [Alphaproteobacteria bacterium]|nr:hypothetical protein [Alphaproteobacteria bacterium]